MILADGDIRRYLEEKRIIIKPQPNLDKQLGAASLDIRLGHLFRVFNETQKAVIDPADPKSLENLTSLIQASQNHPFVLQPGQFVLAVTEEWLALPKDLGARIEGRSSWGRLGIIVHSTAGYIDPGFQGRLTLEMSNINRIPILLYPGARICQLAFETLSSPAEVPYSQKKTAKYAGAKEPMSSKVFKDFLSS